MIRRNLSLFALLVLAACQSAPPPPPVPVPPPAPMPEPPFYPPAPVYIPPVAPEPVPPPAAGGTGDGLDYIESDTITAGVDDEDDTPPDHFTATGDYTPARAFLFSGDALTKPKRTDRPHAWLILDNSNKGRNRKICEHYLGLISEADAAALHPEKKVISTWWPLKTSSVEKMDCKWLVDNYDYARANGIRSSYGIPATAKQAIAAVDSNNKLFYIDMSDADDGQRKIIVESWLAVAQEQGASGTGVVLTSNNLFHNLWNKLKNKVTGLADDPKSVLCPKPAANAATNAAAPTNSTDLITDLVGDVIGLVVKPGSKFACALLG